MKYSLSVIKILIFLVLGCIPGGDDNNLTTIIKREDFKKTADLEGEIMELASSSFPRFFTVIDTLIFVENISPDPFYYHVYGMRSKELIVSFARSGQGPGEFLSCRFSYRADKQDYFYIHDIVAHTTSRYNIDSLISFKDYKALRHNIPDVIKDYVYLSRDSILGYNHYYLDDDRIRNVVDPLIPLKLKDKYTVEPFYEGAEFYTYNVSGAYIIFNKKQGLTWQMDHYSDIITIYNSDLHPVKKLVGPDFISTSYIISESNSVGSKENVYKRSYYPVYACDKSIYAIYAGINGVPYDKPITKPVEVFKFSWSGDLLERYVLDRFIGNLTVDCDSSVLYGTDVEAANRLAENPKLVKYNLRK